MANGFLEILGSHPRGVTTAIGCQTMSEKQVLSERDAGLSEHNQSKMHDLQPHTVLVDVTMPAHQETGTDTSCNSLEVDSRVASTSWLFRACGAGAALLDRELNYHIAILLHAQAQQPPHAAAHCANSSRQPF